MKPETFAALLKAAFNLAPAAEVLAPSIASATAAWGSNDRGFVRNSTWCVQWGTTGEEGRAGFYEYYDSVVGLLGLREGATLERCGFLALDQFGARFVSPGLHWIAVGVCSGWWDVGSRDPLGGVGSVVVFGGGPSQKEVDVLKRFSGLEVRAKAQALHLNIAHDDFVLREYVTQQEFARVKSMDEVEATLQAREADRSERTERLRKVASGKAWWP